MEFESAQSNTTAKLPLLKLSEYEMWETRIKRYLQVQDYALWEVIENGNSWVSVPQTTQENGTSVTKNLVHVTTEEKINKKNDVKARSLLLMALPNEHLLTFSQYSDVKTLYAAIKTLFGGNEATKKTQKALLKQQYENFTTSSLESLDSIFNRLQKIVSRLAILGVVITPEDLNSKFLRSLPPEWNTHVVIWMNKDDIETMSIDDLYNNFKIVEQEVKKSVDASTNSTASLSDATVYAFLANQPNGSQLVHEDLEQIHDDDLEEMDLKWQLALLSMRERKFYQRTGKKITINGSDIAGSDKSKDSTRKTVNVEETSSKAMLAIDGVRFDWSDMAEEQVQKNMALMAFSELNETEFKAATYKRGLATVEDQLVTFKKNEYKKVKKEKEGIDFKIAKFDKSAKSLDEMLTDKGKKGLEYNVVSPPHPLIYNRPTKLDLSYSDLNEFKQPEFNGYGSRDTVLKSTIDCDKELDNSKENTDDSLEKEQVTDNESNSVESPLKYAEMYRSQSPRGNHRNWNGQKSNQLGSEFVMYNKACYRCGSFDHIQINCPNIQRKRRVTGNNSNSEDYDYYSKTSHPSSYRNITPRAVLLKSGLKPLSTARPVYTAQPKPIGKPQMNDKGFVDSGCSRHMTGNIAYLTDFKEFNGGYVTFGGGAYGGRITGKGTLKTNSLDFEDVHYVDELKFNLFSISQMCDKKNNVLFTDTECLVLSPNFKFPDESHILLRIPREDNMYSFDMKNIIPKESLTCLVAKATSDESMTEFKNKAMDDFCKEKGIRREYSVARTPQQNGVAERRNRTLIEAARTMLADSKLPITFWAEAVSTACYVQNRVLIVKPYNKTPYELFRGIKPALSFMKPFGCHVTILNTLDCLGKFDGKSDKSFFVGYSLSSKAFRVYNTRTKKVEENLHIGFLENNPMIEGNGPKWLFDIDSLTQSMNYVPVTAGTSTNESAGTQGDLNAGTFPEKDGTSQDCIVMPIWKDTSYFDSPSKEVGYDDPKSAFDDPKENEDGSYDENNGKGKSKDDSSTKQDNSAEQLVNIASPGLNTGGIELNTVGSTVNTATPKDMVGPSHSLEDTHFEFFNDEDEPDVDLGNIPKSYAVPTTPHTRIHKDHPIENVIGNIQSSIQTRRMKEPTPEHGFLSAVYEAKTHEDLHTCLFACFLSQEEPKRISKVLSHRAIGTKWVFRNKKDERCIVIRNKARLVAQGHTQEEGIDYDEVFAPVARIEAIRMFLAYASFMGFMVYQMDVKSAFLYGQIEEEVYMCQPPGFEDPDYLDKVYRVVKVLYGLHQAPKAWYETLDSYLLGNGFHKGKIDQTLFIKKQKGDILLVQIYVDDIIFGSTKKELYVKSASTPVDLEKPLEKDGDATNVDEHLYRSMIGSLMYPTTSMPDIMFAVCACARFQVTPKTSHLLAVKRIFRYLKGKPTLGLWYSRDSPFELVAYIYSDYAGATQDRKYTTRGRQIVLKSSKERMEGHVTSDKKCQKQIGMSKDIGTLRYISLVAPPIKVGDEAVHKELGDRMERAATTSSSLEAEQDSGNIK
ncbi:putative ribonuclease H-like domain-containing protein [Tanacetum coccineum]